MTGVKLKRRQFLNWCGTMTLGSTLQFAVPPLLTNSPQNERFSRFRLNKPQWIVYENGTFDLIGKELILKNCRPSIDGQTVMPKNVFLGDSPKGKRIVYELSGGFLMLDLKTHKDSISISSEFSGFSRAPRWLHPISQAQIFGVSKCFLQGFGTNGPSMVYALSPGKSRTETATWSHNGYLSFAFLGNNETIVVGQSDHQDFLHRSALYNRIHFEGLDHSKPVEEQFFFEAGMLLEEIKIENEYILLPEIHFYGSNKPFETLQELAWKTGEKTGSRQTTASSLHWFSATGNSPDNSLSRLRRQVEFLKTAKPTLAVHTLAINRGYCVEGDWLQANENWPGGLDRAAREIFKEGHRAGIWIAPFRVSDKSRLFKKHRNWLIRNYNNEIFPEETGELESFYALDISHPDVKKYLAKVFGSLRKMGFIFFETAFLNYGFKDSMEVKRYEKGKTCVQIFREMCEIIRAEMGAGSLWMADHTPYSPLIGFADIVRVGNRRNATSEIEGSGTWSREAWLTHHFNNIYWQNSLCEVSVNRVKSPVQNDEEYSRALWLAMAGGAVGVTSDFTKLSTEQVQLVQFLETGNRQQNAFLPYWPDYHKLKIAIRHYREHRSWGIFFLNDSGAEINEIVRVADLIGVESINIFEWGAGYSLTFGQLTEINIHLQSGQSRLLYLSENDVPPMENLTPGGVNREI